MKLRRNFEYYDVAKKQQHGNVVGLLCYVMEIGIPPIFVTKQPKERSGIGSLEW